MYARNRRTGSEIRGTLEKLDARSDTIANSFERSPTGITHEYKGNTCVFWDSQETMTRQGETVFLDSDGGAVVESEVEVVHELDEPLKPEPPTVAAKDRPDLDEVERETNFTDTVTVYEVVHPDGSGHGRYNTQEEAEKHARPADHIAEAVYGLSNDVHYVERKSEE